MEWRFYDDSAKLVGDNIAIMNGRADNALLSVRQTIDELRDFDPGSDTPDPSNFALPDVAIPPAVAPEKPGSLSLGTVTPWSDPGWESVAEGVGIDPNLVSNPGAFSPTTPLPTFNAAPPPIDTSGAPDPVSMVNVPIPDPPPFDAGTSPPLDTLALTPYPGYVDPGFAGERPVFDSPRPQDSWVWTDPADTNSAWYAEVQAAIHTLLQGGTGIPAVVQQAIWDATRDRVAMIGLADIQSAFDEWAGRGFGMPPGMLVAAVDEAKDKAALQANVASRDVMVQATKDEIENMKAAIANGLQLEAQLRQSFENMVRRSFEASKYHLEIEVKLYDVDVALFNAKQSAYQTDAVVYRAMIEGRIAVLTAWQKEIEGEIAKGQLNEQKVRIYTAQVQAAKIVIEAYGEQVRGLTAKINGERAKVEAYGIEVKAYGELLTARKVVFDAFESENRGKTAQVGAYEAEARAFAETVKASEVEGNLKMKFIDLNIAALRASTEAYQAKLQAEKDRVQSELAQVQAQREVYSADTQRYSVELQGVNQVRAQEIQISEMRLRNNLAYWETELKEYDAALARQIHRVELALEAIKAAGQYGTALAAGAMNAINVGAQISGAGHVNDSYSYNDNVSHKGGDRV